MKISKWVSGSVGTLATIAIWWVVAANMFRNQPKGSTETVGAIPTPPEVLVQFFEDGVRFFAKNATVTLAEAGLGFLWGNLAALALAAVALTLPKLENLATQIAVITYCIPIVAIGPIIRLVVGAPGPGEPAGAAVSLAALSVFFTTMVGALTGVKSADKAALDVVTVFGGNSWHRLIKVQLLSALPSILAALRIAAPAAFLGAILGEYVGGPDVGFGPAMVNAQQSLEVARVWALALVSGAIAGAAYALVGLVSRFVTPWSKGSVTA
ncbi:MAG: ABC transporter permease subunit [Rhodoluna sp.]|nr:ABC transporter permease subunit [Rhodoluna sp.]